MAIEIITLTPEEWQLYKELRLEMLRDEPQAFSSLYTDNLQRPDEFWQERLRQAQAGETSWLVFARAEGQLVGMIGAFRGEDGETGEIVSVYVNPHWRGQGAGLALMEAILAALRQARGIRRARLGVSSEQKSAVALYQRCGFEITGEESGVMGDGNKHTGYIMERAI
jgi:ribosomal protein S18 acetylase RimI-like enzyme